ncbi:MAG TPA: PstS family phosphate ABC transporter substrate-binding protein [Bacteroidales bacterium]|nr:PstS family phosphate ABC transporter substrate-binding protein [Bacteroidales bacterium]HQK37286.1 PstS family phosphate ABC transporter substrate-binding protein [Bacteroidales bacterium]
MRKSVFILSLIILPTAAIINSCSPRSSDKGEAITGEVNIDGSSTVFPLSEAVAEEFRNSYPKVRVTVGESGTGGGFKKFSRGETDINDASRPIRPEEIEACKANGISYLELEVAYDGLAVVVHPSNTWAKEIKVSELKRLWEPAAQGKIMRWNQIRPEWPDKEIHLFGAGTASGTFDYFTEAIVGQAKSSRGDYTASEDDNVLVQGIASDELALGYFGLAYYENNKDKLRILPIDAENGNGPVIPTSETVKSKKYTPLSRPLFIYINSKSLERIEVQRFVSFYLEHCGTLASDVGYVALTPDELKGTQNQWAEFLKQHGK